MNASELSINKLTIPLLASLCERAASLRIGIERCESGAQIIDAGIAVPGGLEAGCAIAEICCGGLGYVRLTHDRITAGWPLTVHVHTSNPVIACLASQYAGWSLSHKEGDRSFHALGSGPARALSRREPLFAELGYRDSCEQAVLVLEVDQPPPPPLIRKIAGQCGVDTDMLSLILTPTNSLAGATQIVARVLEVAMHKAHALGFNLNHIADGIGSAPLAPPASDFVSAMGRTNDAIMFAGRVQLFVNGEAEKAEALAKALPSNTSRDYGKPFAAIFKHYNYDFFKIDPMLFSPAQVTVSHLPSGSTFHAGELNTQLLEKSFAA